MLTKQMFETLRGTAPPQSTEKSTRDKREENALMIIDVRLAETPPESNVLVQKPQKNPVVYDYHWGIISQHMAEFNQPILAFRTTIENN